MKRLFISLGLLMALAGSAIAQDARQRTPQTIVADVLAEMPYTSQADFDSAMGDLLSTGSYGVTQLAGMLVPAAEGQNNRVEYALDGLVAYSSLHATPEQLANARKGLADAIGTTTDNTNKAFLMTLLSRISRADDAPVFVNALKDPYLSEHALSGLILTPETDQLALELITKSEYPKSMLARLAGAKRLTAAEPTLLQWLSGADEPTATSIYKALSLLGTEKSLPVLAKAAKKENYKWVDTDATASYVTLLNALAADPACRKDVEKYAGELLKKARTENVRIGALTALLTAQGTDGRALLAKSMSGPSREYRVAALRAVEPVAGEAEYEMLGRLAAEVKTPDVVKEDIINWLGSRGAVSQQDVIIATMDAKDNTLAKAAFAAAAKMESPELLKALAAHLGGARDAMAAGALLVYKGDIRDAVTARIADAGNAKAAISAMSVASRRRIKEAAPSVFALTESADAQLADAAFEALPGVVAPGDVARLCQRLETSPASRRATYQKALIAALRQLPAAEQYATLSPYVKESVNPQLYYTALATTASPEAVETLLEAYSQPSTRNAAFEALLELDSPKMIDVLYDMALNGDENVNNVTLKRYAKLVERHGKDNIDRYNHYRRGLDISRSDEVKNLLLGRLGATGTYGALKAADAHIGNPATAAASAAAIRSIMSKHVGEYRGEEIRESIVKATDYFKSRTNDADAGYAVDDLKGILERFDADAANATAPSSKLTAEEEAMGFDMLFDGTSMAKWTGDTTTYIVKDGCITVNAAHWGNNIYTADEFGDFIFRFEFALDRPGVNNGVGIRTPMNVDAAFHGMEIQILDHDDPMYADLQPYQVHGSVYGVIPAERVKFKHGEWNTEEIRAEGDHITVTVNGKVILDGNIREACQGHAVGDPGEEGNHYMIDHRNHPGLFNKRGHIGFLGHGDGIRIRNVRILDLDRK